MTTERDYMNEVVISTSYNNQQQDEDLSRQVCEENNDYKRLNRLNDK